MQQMDMMVARLRFLLADTTTREKQLTGLCRQLREQLDRVVTYSIYGDGELDRSLALMADVEQRLSQSEMSLRDRKSVV